jgi:hypothetical protein
MEHISIIALAVMLFIAFGSYNILLGIIWTICRVEEGVIQSIIKMIIGVFSK